MDHSNHQPAEELALTIDLEQVEADLRARFCGRIHDLRIVPVGAGLVLHGRTHSYYIKQLVLHALLATGVVPVTGNRIEVVRPGDESPSLKRRDT
jgi:hypothetical protein